MPRSPWVGILCTPAAPSTLLILYLPATTTTPPLTPHFVTLLAKDRGLFPRCHGDVAREKCKEREGKSRGGERVQPSVLEPACLKTSQGRERIREMRRGKTRGGNLCRHHSPWGLVSVCNGVHARPCRKESVNLLICVK